MEAEREYVSDHLGREEWELGRERFREGREVGLLVLLEAARVDYLLNIKGGCASMWWLIKDVFLYNWRYPGAGAEENRHSSARIPLVCYVQWRKILYVQYFRRLKFSV